MRTRALDVALIVPFLGAIVLPWAGALRGAEGELTLASEKRHANPRPELVLDSAALRAYPGRFQAWYDDRFAGREMLLRAHHRLMLHGLGVSPVPSVVLGEQGWLFLTTGSSVEVHRGLKPMTEIELERWRAMLEARRDWLAERGIDYLYAIAPNKEAIYPELLPASLKPVGPTRLDQLIAWLKEHSDLETLDLRHALRDEKRFDGLDSVYMPLDTHWSMRGAWTAYAEIARWIARRFPAVVPLAREGFAYTPVLYDGDLAKQVMLDDVGPLPTFVWQGSGRVRGVELSGDGFETWRSQVDDPALPRVIFAHDSFGHYLQALLAENCSLLSCMVSYGLPRERILADRLDVVIELHTERELLREMDPFLPDARALPRAAFAVLEKRVAAEPGCALPAGIKTRGTTEIVRTEEEPCGEISIVTRDAADTIELPTFQLPPGTRPAVHLEITVPRQTCLTVWYRTRHEPRHQRANSCPFALEAGRNDVAFVIAVDDVLDGLLLRPALEPGRFVLHSLEIAAAPR